MNDNPITQAQLNALEKAADKVFSRLGIDIEFTRHFLDRVNDERNRKQITVRELAEILKKEYMKWGRKIADMPVNSQAVMKDLSTELNIPFVLTKDGDEKDLVAKTVMRKKDFKTPNTELPVESVEEDTHGAKKGSQVKGTEPMPKKQKAGRGPNSPHPMRGRLVGENAHSKDLYYVQPDGEWKKGGDGRSKGRKRSELPKGAKISEAAVLAAWEQYKLDEIVLDPREAILRKALAYLDKEISDDAKDRMDAGGHAFSVARIFNIGMGGRELLKLYHNWKQSGQVMESWFSDNLPLITEVWGDEDT